MMAMIRMRDWAEAVKRRDEARLERARRRERFAEAVGAVLSLAPGAVVLGGFLIGAVRWAMGW
jgi:hypothetical protein